MVFIPAGFSGFHTVTDSWFFTPWMSPEDLLGRDRSPSGSVQRWSVSAEVALSEKSPNLGGAGVRLFFEVHLSRTPRTRQSLPRSSNHPSVSSGFTDTHHLVAVTSPLSPEIAKNPK